MKLIIHDLNQSEADRLFGQHPDDAILIGKDQEIHQCVGCYGCWVETPGLCKIKDDFSDIGKRMAQSDEVEIISRCLYGGFSPFVKNVLDRTLPYHCALKQNASTKVEAFLSIQQLFTHAKAAAGRPQ